MLSNQTLQKIQEVCSHWCNKTKQLLAYLARRKCEVSLKAWDAHLRIEIFYDCGSFFVRVYLSQTDDICLEQDLKSAWWLCYLFEFFKHLKHELDHHKSHFDFNIQNQISLWPVSFVAHDWHFQILSYK